MKRIFMSLLLLGCMVTLSSQDNKLIKKLSERATPAGLEELVDFLSIPNDALFTDDIDSNIEWLKGAFQRRKFETRVLSTTNTPLFFAERKFPDAKKTVLFYMHFDGQGVDPSKWMQESPYKPVFKVFKDSSWMDAGTIDISRGVDPEYRIFARSSSDDKSPIVMLLTAIDILDSEFDGKSGINIKVILDGEEEKGSGQLKGAVQKYSDLLVADYMVINDGPIHISDRPTIVFGGRGIKSVNITVYGPRTAQHSGHYGNYAPNPAFMLSHLLASMKDREGRVLIKGFYDGIELNDKAMEMLRSVPDDPETINRIIGIARPEKVGSFYQESLQYPSLNVRGMQSAWIGKQVRTIVPDKAVAAIDIRLVPEVDPERLAALVHDHLVKQGCYVIDREPTEEERLTKAWIVRFDAKGEATLPFRTDASSDLGVWLTGALGKGTGKEPVRVRIMGGTVPIVPFIKALNIPAVIVPMVNADNNQHGPNENLRIWNFTNGIMEFISMMLY